jgi:poly-gamma-glutamate capsule biosynthesis protein CapA/YwtB (metallophosphatase superfamily)
MTSKEIKRSGCSKISIYAIGDVCIQREKPESIFSLLAPTLHKADIRYCHLEESISVKGYRDPDVPLWGPRIPPEHVSGLTHAGFDVISHTGIHSTFWGMEAFLDTKSILNRNGIRTTGGGKNIYEARKPAIIERNGTRVAFLAYTSFMRSGFWAEKDKPGVAPLRVHTFYEPQLPMLPGWDAQVHTCLVREDLAAMKNDVIKAKLLADIVIVSWHAGIPFVKAELAEYQSEGCYAAIDVGADAIIGHFTHVIKAIEVYKGKPIFYSLGNCTFEHNPEHLKEITEHEIATVPARFGLKQNPDDPLLGYYPPDARKSMIAKIIIADKKIDSVSFIPVVINKQNEPEAMKRGSKAFKEVLKYIKESTKEAGIDTKFVVKGDEVSVVI